MTLDSPNIGGSVTIITSSRVGQNKSHAAIDVCDSILHLEMKNYKSSGHLLMARFFDKFRAFLISAALILSE